MQSHNILKVSVLIAALLGSGATFASANGTPVAGDTDAARSVAVTSGTEYFNVFQGDILRFNLADGTQFSWKFDGNANYVNLSDIAPKGAVKENVRVYVSTPND